MEKEQLIRLVTKAQAGDQAAMDSLFTNFYNDIYYFALKTLKDQDLACDITQETFLLVIQAIKGLKEPAAFGTWIRQIAYHQCTRYFAKKKEVLVEEDEEGNSIFDTLADQREDSVPSQVLEQQEFRQTIMGMIDQLTEEQRSAVLLYYFEELSVSQIAKIQSVSEGTVKSRLNYARKAIKKSVEGYEKKHNIKLHSFSLLPLLLLFFGKEKMPARKAEEMRLAVAQAAKGAVKGAATATLGAKLASLPLVTKVVAGVVAGSLVLGGAALAVKELAKEPADQPGQTDYAEPYGETQKEDSVLELLPVSLEYRDVFVEYYDDFAYTYRTRDGKLAWVHNDISYQLPADAEFIWTSTRFPAYRDSNGMVHCMVGGDESQWVAFPGEDLRTLVGGGWRSEEKTEVIVNYVDINGAAWWIEVDTQTGEILDRRTIPIVAIDTNAPLQNIEKFGSNTNKKYRIMADGWIYEGTDHLQAKNTGVPAAGLLSDLRTDRMIWKDGGTVYVDGEAVSLPEGKELVKTCAAYVSVFLFDDGSVYLHGAAQAPEGLWYCEELTNLNRAGRIKQIATRGVGQEQTAIFILDDNLSYYLDENLTAAEPEQPVQTVVSPSLHKVIDSCWTNTIILKNDGAVSFWLYEDPDFPQEQVEAMKAQIASWSDLISVAAGQFHMAGLKPDGTVVVADMRAKMQSQVQDWTDIVSITAGSDYLAGLKADGTVVATVEIQVPDKKVVSLDGGDDDKLVAILEDGTACQLRGESLPGLEELTNVAQLSLCNYCVVALKTDGTVQVLPHNEGFEDCSDWTDIVQVEVSSHLVGLKADGTVVVAGSNMLGECETDRWTDIVAVDSSAYGTMGVRRDGTMIKTGVPAQDMGIDWTNIRMPER